MISDSGNSEAHWIARRRPRTVLLRVRPVEPAAGTKVAGSAWTAERKHKAATGSPRSYSRKGDLVTTSQYFEVTLALRPDCAALSLCGELDLAAAPLLQEHLDRVYSGDLPQTLLIDVSRLHYCDSCGTRTLVEAATRCARAGTRFRVVGAQRAVRRVFEIMNAVEILKLDDQ